MKFYFKYELSQVRATLATILNDDELTILKEDIEVFV